MTRSRGASRANQLFRRSGTLSPAAHVGYAASVLLHIGLGVVAVLIAVVTAVNDNLAPNERLDVNDAQLQLAVLMWVVALATLGLLWARRSPWGWLAPLVWALIGLPLAVTHAQIETIPPQAACATAGRIEPGLTSVDVSAPPPVAWCYEAASPIREVAAAADGIYLTSTTGTLTALDRTSGTVRWESETGAVTSAIVARPGEVYGGGERSVTAWNSAGQQRWIASTPGPVTALAANAASDVYVACADGTILALDGATGAVRWQSLVPVPDPQVVVAGELIYAFNTDRTITIAVLDGGSGEIRGAWIYDNGPQVYLTQPVLAGTTLVAGYEVRSDGGSPLTGGAIGMEPLTGAIVWDRPLDAPVQIAPVNAGGAVHILALNGQLYRLEPLSGQEARPREIIESRGKGDQIASRLLVTDGNRIYIGQRSSGVNDDSVYSGVVTATNSSGSALWRLRLSESPSLPVTLVGDLTLVPDGEALFAVRESSPATPAATPVQ